MNKRTILHRDYTIEYERNPERTGVTIWYVGSPYLEAFDESLSYGTDKDMTLHDICAELLEEIRKFQRTEPDADYYYAEYTDVALGCFIGALRETIEEEK